MKEIHFETRIPVVKETDVVVVGGGVSGVAAAICAARNGARTLLIERHGILGGCATTNLVGPFMTSFSNDGERQLVQGIFEEIVRRMESIGGAIHPEKVRNRTAYAGYRIHGHDHVTPFEPEAMKRVSMEMVREAGVDVRLHTMFVDVAKCENSVDAVLTFSKSGFEAFRGRMVIDCSGDGDVAAAAGVPFRVGRQDDGLCQPLTLFFIIGNVNDAAVEEYRRQHPEEGERLFATIIDEKRKTGEWTVARDKVLIFRTPRPGEWRVNITRVQGRSGLSADDLSAAEFEARDQVFVLLDFFRKYIPGMEAVSLVASADEIGVRDTRRIEGEYTLTIDDLSSARQFDDVVMLYGYPVDIHDPVGIHGGCTNQYNTAPAYEIPYRSLVPKGIDNMLVAGRCFSASFEAHGAARVMPSSIAMGQATGTAAALALKGNCRPRDINIGDLHGLLLAQNVYLGPRFEGRSACR